MGRPTDCLSLHLVYPPVQYLTMWLSASSRQRGHPTICPVVTTQVVGWLVSLDLFPSPQPKSKSNAPRPTIEQRFIHRAAIAALCRSLGGTSTRPPPAVPGSW